MRPEDIKVLSPFKGCIYLRFPNQYLLCATFMRFQEYYESPHKELNGNPFTFEKAMDIYAKGNDWKMSYFEDWNGFNIPGHIFWNARMTFLMDRTEKEEVMCDVVGQAICNLNLHECPYYVIATDMTSDCEDHEQAHALFYLNERYRKSVLTIEQFLDPQVIEEMKTWLVTEGYSLDVEKDEINSYLIDTLIFGEQAKWFKMLDNHNTRVVANSLLRIYKHYRQIQQSL